MSPIPKKLGTLRFTVVRQKEGFANLGCRYILFNESEDTFFLNSKKKIACKTPYHTFSSTFGKFDKRYDSYLGKLRGDHSKHHYILFDCGATTKNFPTLNSEFVRKELCAIVHKKPENSDVYTKTFDCILPTFGDNGFPKCPSELNNKGRLMEDYLISKENIVFKTVPARYSKSAKQYIIDFDEKIEQKSVKNFQLRLHKGVPHDPIQSDIYLEFGKIKKDKFTLTVKWPFSIMAAFATAISGCEGSTVS